MKQRRFLGLLVGAALVAAACGTGATPSPTFNLPTAVGEGEGELTVLAWPGYAENGSTDETVDWVTPFEDASGCKVTVQVFGTSDEAFSLFSTNPTKYDIVSASGDASLRLVRAGYVQPVNVDLVPSYADIFPALKDKPYNTVDGVHYGIPHGRGSNLLMWRTDEVSPAPTSWTEMFDPDSPYAGKVSVYDAPIYIADAAVVLMDTNPELGIKNPYALDETQFQAAVDLLKAQKPAIGQYWVDYTKQMDAFRAGDAVIGTTWQVITYLLQAEDPPVEVDVIKPEEGATGWSDTWMVNSKTTHPNCAYKWLDHIVSPEVNAQIAAWFGEAPGNSKACALTEADQANCDFFHAADDAFWQDVWYWQTPEAKCVDGRTDKTCKTFDDWVKAWTEIKG
ncbi:MAG: spermidine/putrescine ABC transporter substrate-binding protein [Chloroflexi bacterium RBG_16_70_13]|nr:MAG: spermidine/putrescine ABC transporter substrate-binding protein [Chloroflexi bacterium RBG_16_70_13]